MTGYSGTPLLQKLGIKPGQRRAMVNLPSQVRRVLGALAGEGRLEASLRTDGPFDFLLCFVRRRSELARMLPAAARRLEPTGMLWIAWPKKASKMPSDLTENVVRDIGLRAGLVDVKVCAIDDTWSGLKFVRRLADRPRT